jgi:hypothetical protein
MNHLSTAPTALASQRAANSRDALDSACSVEPAQRLHLFDPGQAAAPSALETLFDLSGPPGYYNVSRQAALLRRGKRPPHDELLVDFSGREVRLHMTAAGEAIVRGEWSWRATAGGETLAPAGKWEEVCWHRDRGADYLEIELPLSGGWRLERQMLLARQDRFLFLADALLGPAAAAVELHYEHVLPLAERAAFLPAQETREGWLSGERARRATVLPLALAEWRAEYCHAELAALDGQLRLAQAAAGRNLYAPLWIDLDPARLRRPATWRRLTVGENLAIVPRDVAVGYRIQVGDEQWLIYQSLDRIGNRSVLGVNTVSSFACLRFFTSGKTEEIVAME